MLFERRVKSIIHQLQAVAWHGTPPQYAYCNQASNLLASAIGVRKAPNRKKQTRKRGKRRAKKQDKVE